MENNVHAVGRRYESCRALSRFSDDESEKRKVVVTEQSAKLLTAAALLHSWTHRSRVQSGGAECRYEQPCSPTTQATSRIFGYQEVIFALSYPGTGFEPCSAS